MIRVLLVDDHRILRQALARMLEGQNDIEVVGEAADGEQAIALAQKLKPNVVVMDVSMPRVNGIDATRRILSLLTNVRIVALSMHEDAGIRQSMLEAGADAYVSKGGPPSALFAAIRNEADQDTPNLR